MKVLELTFFFNGSFKKNFKNFFNFFFSKNFWTFLFCFYLPESMEEPLLRIRFGLPLRSCAAILSVDNDVIELCC